MACNLSLALAVGFVIPIIGFLRSSDHEVVAMCLVMTAYHSTICKIFINIELLKETMPPLAGAGISLTFYNLDNLICSTLVTLAFLYAQVSMRLRKGIIFSSIFFTLTRNSEPIQKRH
jgi:hypothetical protein